MYVVSTHHSSSPVQQQARKQHCYNSQLSSSVTEKKQLCRPTKQCPVENCRAVVIHVPRHLRGKHRWNSRDAQNAVPRLYNMRCRRSRSGKPAKYKDYHKHRKCPIDGCSAVVKRLPPHLSQKHEIPSKSAMFFELLQKARHLAVTEENTSLSQLDGNDIYDNTRDRSFEDQTTHSCAARTPPNVPAVGRGSRQPSC